MIKYLWNKLKEQNKISYISLLIYYLVFQEANEENLHQKCMPQKY